MPDGTIANPSPREGSRSLPKKLTIIAWLVGATLTAEWLLIYGVEPDSLSYWLNAICFPLFPLVAGAKCIHTALGRRDAERRAWLMFGLALICMSTAEAIWGYYEIFITDEPPPPYISDLGYALLPLLSMLGIWFYHDRRPTVGVSWVQAGSLGIVISSIVLSYVVVFYGLHQSSLGPGAADVALVHGALWLCAPAFGLFTVSVRLLGPKRAIMALILLGLSMFWVSCFAYLHLLLNGVYLEDNPLYGLYLVASALLFFAATEQDRLAVDAGEAKIEPEAEERAEQWEALLPTGAVAILFVVTLVFRDNLNEDIVPALASTMVLFVVSLGARNWWGQRVHGQLQADARESQDRMLAANLDLEHEVEIRTRAEEELRHSQKMETMGQLTGGVAHDFNNLLGVIQADLELLAMREAADEEARGLVASALTQVKRGSSLTRYLLALSRKQSLNPQHIDVAALLSETRSVLARTLGARIAVSIEAMDGLWPCLADRAQLESAILNLAINARDAMPKGGDLVVSARNRTIDLPCADTQPSAEAGSYVVISVRDTGEGISQNLLGRVFEPFYTTKKIGEGTGLGLSMVCGFAKQFGGHVEIDSEFGRGTEVRLFLPRATDSEDSAEASLLSSAPMGAEESVLLVEDEPALRRLMKSLLEGLNYKVMGAANADEALGICEAVEIDLMLTDVDLAGSRSGVELAREFAEKYPCAQVLLMSGIGAEALKDKEDLAPGQRVLAKPFTRVALANELHSALESPLP